MHNNLKPIVRMIDFLSIEQPNLNNQFRSGIETNDYGEEVFWTELLFETLDESTRFIFVAYDGTPPFCEEQMPNGCVFCFIDTKDPYAQGSFDDVEFEDFFTSLENARYE